MKDQRSETLQAVRRAMTSAEIGHWIGFGAMGVLTLAVWIAEQNIGLLAFNFSVNVFGNAYLSLLQQYNKIRIDRLVVRRELAERSG